MIDQINSEIDYEKALLMADEFFKNPPLQGSEGAKQFESLLLLIKK
ncbi:MAG: hypothetical protein RIQ70_1001 [Bacteroidota bacterium]|jgi:hypothetical protein